MNGLSGYIDRKIVMEACNALNDRQKIASIYQFFKIVDGDFVKTECETGNHEYELIRVHEDDYYTTDEQAEKGPTYFRVFQCAQCGKKHQEHAGKGLRAHEWEAVRNGSVRMTCESHTRKE